MVNIVKEKINIKHASCGYRLLVPSHLKNIWRHVVFSMLIMFIVILSACSDIPTPIETARVPLYYVQQEIWQSIDEQLLNASVSARKKSDAYARELMDNWRWRVRQMTEDVFIPWYSSYLTQQWMASRVAWYEMQYTEGEPTPKERLTDYLQQQFYEQVLEPVSEFVEPRTVMEETTAIYLRQLKKCVDQIPYQYQIPVAELNRHLTFIPAIDLQKIQSQNASLYDVLQIKNLSILPAYKSLLTQIDVINGGISSKTSNNSLNRAAERAVTKLVEQMKVQSASSIASFIAGGHLGVFISLSAMTWNAAEHQRDKSKMELQLQENLDVMLEDMWQDLVIDKRGGVTAVVHHMSEQIEYSLFTLDSPGSKLF